MLTANTKIRKTSLQCKLLRGDKKPKNNYEGNNVLVCWKCMVLLGSKTLA